MAFAFAASHRCGGRQCEGPAPEAQRETRDRAMVGRFTGGCCSLARDSAL